MKKLGEFQTSPKYKMEQAKKLQEEKEKCVSCGKDTPYTINTPVDLREYYIEGAGQLCMDCYFHIFETRKR